METQLGGPGSRVSVDDQGIVLEVCHIDMIINRSWKAASGNPGELFKLVCKLDKLAEMFRGRENAFYRF